jgi:hypothetical protein
MSTWYFSEICGPKLLGFRSSESLIVLDQENELHKKIYAGAEVLWKVTMDNWDRLGGERDG